MHEFREIESDNSRVNISVIFDGQYFTMPTITITQLDGSEHLVFIDNIGYIYENNLVDRLESYFSGVQMRDYSDYKSILDLLTDTPHTFIGSTELLDLLVLIKVAESKGWFEDERREFYRARKLKREESLLRES